MIVCVISVENSEQLIIVSGAIFFLSVSGAILAAINVPTKRTLKAFHTLILLFDPT